MAKERLEARRSAEENGRGGLSDRSDRRRWERSQALKSNTSGKQSPKNSSATEWRSGDLQRANSKLIVDSSKLKEKGKKKRRKRDGKNSTL